MTQEVLRNIIRPKLSLLWTRMDADKIYPIGGSLSKSDIHYWIEAIDVMPDDTLEWDWVGMMIDANAIWVQVQ